jgi:hypothetical protein
MTAFWFCAVLHTKSTAGPRRAAQRVRVVAVLHGTRAVAGNRLAGSPSRVHTAPSLTAKEQQASARHEGLSFVQQPNQRSVYKMFQVTWRG